MRELIIGGIYKDCEDAEYLVLEIARDTETCAGCIICRRLDSLGYLSIALDRFGYDFSYVRIEEDIDSYIKDTEIEGILQGGTYTHFKGKEYKVLFVSKDCATNTYYVVYKALYGAGEVWARPLSMFKETVQQDGVTINRFTLNE